MNKKLERITENDLKQIVKESVKKILKEEFNLSRDPEERFRQLCEIVCSNSPSYILDVITKNANYDDYRKWNSWLIAENNRIASKF